MRHKLLKLFQKIDTLSASILKYGVEDEANNVEDGNKKIQTKKISSEQFKLQRNIRLFAINYLKDNSFTLSQLPTINEYNELKAKRQVHLLEEMRRIEIEQNFEKQRLNEQIARKQNKLPKFKLNEENKGRTNGNLSIKIDNSNGWIPSVDRNNAVLFENANNEYDATIESDEERTLKIQINLVDGYIKEAIKQDRNDEVKSLRQNLNELKARLKSKQRQT